MRLLDYEVRGPHNHSSVFGAWLSLVERSVRDREVVGSNPIAPTFIFNSLETWLFSASSQVPKIVPTQLQQAPSSFTALVPLQSPSRTGLSPGETVSPNLCYSQTDTEKQFPILPRFSNETMAAPWDGLDEVGVEIESNTDLRDREVDVVVVRDVLSPATTSRESAHA